MLRSEDPSAQEIEADNIALSRLRTMAFAFMLVTLIAMVILGVVGIAGALGAWLISSGFVTLEHLTSIPSIVAITFLCSIIIATIICAGVQHSLVLPLRRMTAAMQELARGNFSIRMRRPSRHSLREVNAFVESFNVAAEELSGTEMMRSSFISDFSHEFRTPINALMGFAQLVRDDPDLSQSERDEYLGIIVDEARRLANLSERVLLLSKMEAMAILPDVTSVDVAETVRRAVAMEELRAEEKGVEVHLALDSCHCAGNADYLVQLWTNILDNAVKFSEEGGRVDVALYGGRTGEEGRDTTGDELVCWISDSGCGMDAETREHLFERFYQGDSSHASEGSGLGLALCRRIVELHGGSISVQSSPGKGSVFEVRLPLQRS